MRHPVTISVVMASYNHGKFVKEAIESVLNQTYQNIEIVVTDDGSCDDSVEIIKAINDDRIKLFEFKENKGACTALNNSIINSNGKYIAVMNSDDVWTPKKLETQINFLLKHDSIDAVFSQAEFLDENLEPFSEINRPFFHDAFNQKNRSSAEWLYHFFFNGNCICHPSILIKKECYDKIGLYNNRFRQFPDLDMWIRFCKEFSFHVLKDKSVKFRLHSNDGNASSPTPENVIRNSNEMLLILNDFFDGMSIENFKDSFSKELINPAIETQEEFEIEKAFLYLKTPYKILAIQRLFRFISDEQYASILLEKYNYSDKDFHKTTALASRADTTDTNVQISLLIEKIKRYPKTKLLRLMLRRLYFEIKHKFT